MLNKVNNLSVVKGGFEVYNIAKEVYKIVNEDEKVQEKKAEEIYKEAASKVTSQKESEIEQRVDYQVVQNASQITRKTITVAKDTQKKLLKRYLKLKAKTMVHYEQLMALLKANVKLAKERVSNNQIINSEQFKNAVKHLRIAKLSIVAFSKTLYKAVDSYVDFNECYNQSMQISNQLVEQYERVKNMASEGMKSASEVVCKNVNGLTENVSYNYQYAKQSLSTDYDSLKEVLLTNKDLFINYIKNLELEVYYSPLKSIKIMENLNKFIEESIIRVKSAMKCALSRCNSQEKTQEAEKTEE